MNTNPPAYTRRRSIVSSCPRCPFKAATTQKDERPRRSTTSNLPSSSSRHEHSRTMNKTIDYSEWDKAMNIYCNAREDEKIPTTNTPKQHCLDVVVDKRLPSRKRSSVTALTMSMSTESSIETSVLLEARRVAQEEENGYYIYTCDDDSCISSLQDSIYPKKKHDEEDDLDWERLESFMDNDFLNDDKIEECYDALVHLHKVYKEKNEKKIKTSMKSSAALQRRPVFASPQVEQYRVGRRCPAA